MSSKDAVRPEKPVSSANDNHMEVESMLSSMTRTDLLFYAAVPNRREAEEKLRKWQRHIQEAHEREVLTKRTTGSEDPEEVSERMGDERTTGSEDPKEVRSDQESQMAVEARHDDDDVVVEGDECPCRDGGKPATARRF